MRYEMRTRTAWYKGDPELVMEWLILPRGGANRPLATGLAKVIKSNERMAPHIRTVKVFTSKVVVHFKASITMAADLLMMIKEAREREAERRSNQLPLFDPNQGIFAIPKS